MLDCVGKTLREVDLRNNPLTVGFYTPQETVCDEKRVVPHRYIRRTDVEDEAGPASRSAEQFLLPNLNKNADDISRDRLDDDTKLRRRVYEMLVVNGCKTLERLDGLEVNRKSVGRRDGVWERLVELGVLREKGMTDKGGSKE